MSRRTTVPHQHNDMVADTVKKYIWSPLWSSPIVGSGASGNREYLSAATPWVHQTVTSTTPCVRFESTSAYATAFWNVPDDMHVGSATNFKVWWMTQATTASQTATWTLTYANLASGAAVGDGTTALGTALVADTDSTTAYGLNISATAGTIAAGTLTNGNAFQLKLQLSAVSGLSAANDFILFLGLEIEYTRRFI